MPADAQFTNYLVGIVGFLVTVMFAVFGFMGRGGLKDIRSISTDVATINSRTASLETGLSAHIKQDDERHENIQREQNALWAVAGHRKGDQT